MPSAHANIAAVQAAGFLVTQTDRGATFGNDRFLTVIQKWMTGGGTSGHLLKAHGVSSVSQAAADTNAVAALNKQRDLRYGAAAAGGGVDHTSTSLTTDVS